MPDSKALGAAVGAALIAVGSGALAFPKLSSLMFGIPADEANAQAYMRAAGLRDAIVGATILTSLDDPSALRRVLALGSLIGLADAALLFAARGLRPSHGLHLGGFFAVAFLAASVDE